MERLKSVKETLMNALQSQMGNLQTVDTKELGEVVDMVKDLEEAIYYCTITKAMGEKEEGKQQKEIERHYYTERPYYPPMDYTYRNMYYGGDGGRGGEMYYNGGGSSGGNSGMSSGNGGGSRNMYYTENGMSDGQGMTRDGREGRSGGSRRTYIEAKDMKKGQAMQIKELEHYIQELSNDLVEMVEGASPEEKNLLKQHLKTISEKIK